MAKGMNMTDLRNRIPAQALMEKTLQLHAHGGPAVIGEAEAWYRGALGEIVVAGVLAQLPAEWTVLHSVPVGDSDTDIDHVVIGPSGVFTINTKSSPFQKLWIGGFGLLVDGQKTRYIPNAIHEATRAAQLLSSASSLTVPVTPLIVFVTPGPRLDKAPAEGGVVVLGDHELLNLLLGRRREFSDEQIDRITCAAVQPRTWSRFDRTNVADPRLAIRFHALVARELTGVLPRLRRPETANSPSVRAAVPPRSASTSTRRASSRRQRLTWRSRLVGLIGGVVAFGFIWTLFTVVLPALMSAASNR